MSTTQPVCTLTVRLTNIVVIEINTDLSPKTVLFSGTYGVAPSLSQVQDNGEPA